MNKLAAMACAFWMVSCAPMQEPTGSTSLAATDIAQLSPEEQQKVQQAGSRILFWSDTEREQNFRHMETLFPGINVSNDGAVRMLPQGESLNISTADLERVLAEQKVAGIMVLQDGKVRYEHYGLDFGPEQRWTSFSVAKSFTSTLVGAAIKDGYIASVDDPVTRYVSELKGSAYENVTVEQVLTMTSGVKWNEDYTDPNSDVVKMLSVPIEPGHDPNVDYLARLPREAEPGTKWVYKTGETNLIGVIVARATGRSLADYAKEKIVDPAGFAGALFWMVDPVGQNIGGCCLSIRLSDYARMGQFVLEGGVGVDGKRVVPEGWFAAATAEQANIGAPGYGYGYQWWIYPMQAYGAQGIFGQAIYISPENNAVIAVVSNWPKASDRALRNEQRALFTRLLAGL